ncbi:MAG TPA: twin-arginine translocation signal domain-containing protein, partial [Ktedonobacteraceae bacterium]|nr:twin-arginine translocation signal domain-containing protein [Ktedonobacteraceae bacterium]
MEHNAQQAQKEKIMEENVRPSKRPSSRRSFLRKGLVAGGAGTIGAALVANGFSLPAFAEERDRDKERSDDLTSGDVAILRFAAAIE